MSVIHAPTKRELDLRALLPLIAVVLGLGVMFVRLWYLQVVRGEDLSDRARALRTNKVAKLAPRGLIYDRNGTLVAGIKQEIVVTAKPAEAKKNPWVLDKVALMIGVPVEKLWDKVKQNQWRPHLPTPLFVGVPLETAARILESADELPGIGIESQPMRFYPDTKSLCHLLGYVWTPSDRDIERYTALGLIPADYVGKDGLEREYEADLMGVAGSETLEFDAKRRPLRVIGRDNPTPGNRLILGLDLKLQQLAEAQLEGRRGAVAAIDPSTGEVLCLASSPGFDASLFQKGISTENWNMLRLDDDHPLINRAAGSAYAPGSTFKIVVTLAAMKKGIFSTSRPAVCRGYYQMGRGRWKCLGVHGAITYNQALARSCNAYFADLGVRVGAEALTETAVELGLGRKTGIDLPSEGVGSIPTQSYLARRKIHWVGGDMVNTSIGQGYVATTPLQMACIASLVANEGVSYKPHIVRARVPSGMKAPEPVKTEILGKIDLPSTDWQILKQAMVSVIESGTATVARIPGVVWGGKTGSAEHRKAEQTHSWFVGVAPMDHPKIAICVLVEAAGHGNTVAAPIARDVVKGYLLRQPKPASASSNAAAPDSTSTAFPDSPTAR